MKRTKVFGAAVAAILVIAAPTLALAHHPGNPGNPHTSSGVTGPHGTTGNRGSSHKPSSTPPSNAAAFGVLCRKESKRHVHGQKGTPFSQCVTALAKLDSGKATNPARACAGLSKRHVRGHKGTPFSECVVAAAHLRGHGHGGLTGPTGPTGPSGPTGP